MSGTLYFGDNLDVLREHVRDESVDLIYLDPPFNSAASYNVLFKAPDGKSSQSQITAFEDTWHWTETSETAFDEVMRSGRTDVANVLRAMRQFLGENDMMAYLAMMAVRMIELHRVLKSTGSLYLHCDATTSHYLKLIVDSIFNVKNFKNEIIWERTNSHNMKSTHWHKSSDTILFYTKSDNFNFNRQYGDYEEAQLSRFKKDADGRLYKAENLTFSTVRRHRQFEWRGTKPPSHRSWGADLERLEKWYAEGRILLKADGTPRMDGLKVYLDDLPGKQIGNIWTDIDRVTNTGGERLGYPTQKPVALLERILSASSNVGDVVLDPFCGCGTTVHAAQKLKRRWTGIDVTPIAVNLISRRLKEAFPGLDFSVRGIPRDMDGARELANRDKFLFQLWACDLVDAQPFKDGKKGADGGIDGMIYFKPDGKTTKAAVVSVKGGGNVGVGQIRDLRGTIERLGEPMGVFVTLTPPTAPMTKEAASAGIYDTGTHRVPRIQILTAEQLLGGEKPRLPFGHNASYRKAGREKDKNAQFGLEL